MVECLPPPPTSFFSFLSFFLLAPRRWAKCFRLYPNIQKVKRKANFMWQYKRILFKLASSHPCFLFLLHTSSVIMMLFSLSRSFSFSPSLPENGRDCQIHNYVDDFLLYYTMCKGYFRWMAVNTFSHKDVAPLGKVLRIFFCMFSFPLSVETIVTVRIQYSFIFKHCSIER